MDGLDYRGVPLESLSVTSLGMRCFAGCTSITSLVSFPHLVTVIPEECFSGCTGFQSEYNNGSNFGLFEGINIPGQVKEIHTKAFLNAGASYIRFYEPQIFYEGSEVRKQRNTTLTRIDQGAFFGQAENGTLDTLTYKLFDIRYSLGGADANGTLYGPSNKMTITFTNQGDSTIRTWFTCENSPDDSAPTYIPTWAPWGVGEGWKIKTYNQDINPGLNNHQKIMCFDFVASAINDKEVWWKQSGDTRLDALLTADNYDVTVSKNFSPYYAIV